MKKIVNFDYLSLWKELPLFWLITVILRRQTVNTHQGRVLIVNPCLMGEFAASVPAIADYIQRNKDKKIDLMVSPPQKVFAERIAGVSNVYGVQSVYNRPVEIINYKNEALFGYEKVILLRVSAGVFHSLKRVGIYKINSGAWSLTQYAFHLLISLIFRRTPMQYRVLNFETLGGVPRDISPGEIFSFKPEDYKNVNAMPVVQSKNKKIIIHTCSSWKMMHWENEKWIKLISEINKLGAFEFIFVGGQMDVPDYEYISSRMKFKVNSVIGKLNLLELFLLLLLADYFIGVDSGPSNMAHIAGLRSLVIYGPGPHLYIPSNPNDIIIDKSNGRGFYQRFFYKKNGFIQKISFNEVFRAFSKLLLKNSDFEC